MAVFQTLTSKNFDVSYDSAKRDLRILEEKGLLKELMAVHCPFAKLQPEDLKQ